MKLPPVYPILDTASLERLGLSVADAAEGFLEGGAQVLQLRHKSFWSREIYASARRIASLCEQARIPFFINDRADYAALLNAGLHIGQEDLSPADVRRIVPPGTAVGFSTHNAAQMTAARGEPVDYVAFGPVFTTGSKERPDPVAGLHQLRAVRELTDKPLVAIGGITRLNAPSCREAGADSVAVIADLLPSPATRHSVRERMAEWRRLS